MDNELNFSIAFYSFILIYVLINTLLVSILFKRIYGIYQRYSFVKSFGKSTGFAILAIFFPTITNCILVFSDVEYEGPQKHLFMR